MTTALAADPATPAHGPAALGEPLHASGLCLSLGGQPVLRDVDLHVPAGAIVALLGPSGCGKTTLLRSLSGLEHPTAGSIRLGRRTLLDGEVVVRPEHRRIGMVFQDWALFPHMTVARNVGFGLTRAERRSGRVQEVLALVDLEGYGPRMPATLSGGQQQRIALARALVTRPGVILLDEPFSNLDAALRGQIRGDVTRLLRRLGVTAVFVTHDQEEAFALGDEVAVMLDGRIRQQCSSDELYGAPVTRAVAAFVGDANLLRGAAAGDHAVTDVGVVPLRQPRHGEVDVLVRPEHLLLGGDGQHRAEVVELEFYGHDAVCRLRTPGGTRLTVRTLSRPQVRDGDVVHVAYCGPPTVAYPSG